MNETDNSSLANYKAFQKYKDYALKMISKLEKIKAIGKGKIPAGDIVTQSSVGSVIVGLGDRFPELTTKLKGLLKHSFNHSDLVKLHQTGKIDLNNWEDRSLNEIMSEINRIKHQVNNLKSENAEMAQSDVTKIIDYSEKLQSMFDVNDNLEDWVKAKLNHACDYVATVRDYLKFYHDEKEAGTPDDQIDEKWTNTYKKSINCSNPKGFSQKAHCKARRLRQMGKKTKSKPVKEIYEAVVRHMLKEFNSSMAMGALKQLNSDAKELETMLQPNTQLEDWVKAKLNLAGEYLDDVYHHLDHFGPQGRKFDEVKVAHDLEEGWKDWLAAGAIGLGAMSGKVDASKMKPADQAAITQSVQKSVGSFMDYIKKVENQGKVGYNAEKKLWFPHKSFEGGSDTIGYGHKIQKGEDFSKGITDAQAESLLKTDLAKAKQQVYKELGSVKLTPQQEEMFVDFVFNMGTLKKFPKFTEFALKNDLEGMKSQYKRYAGGKELKGRNSEFLKRFLAEYFGFTTYF
jgi:GH24 family phage-related lysozyme (muramidase)